ncbi:MAG TPA: ribonuclease E inhibitor RraB [Solirubrobacteraceae bacterium]|nr:ribonuclease E inhibitor RraB [Solirubrobacteraceae bacterium]
MADEEAEFEILSEEGETPEEHDLEILETLEEHGADLSEPREVRVDLLFPTEESAQAADEELTELGYEVVGFESAGEEEPWAIRATRELQVGRENVTGFRHRFEELAARHGGEFDGWEAADDA